MVNSCPPYVDKCPRNDLWNTKRKIPAKNGDFCVYFVAFLCSANSLSDTIRMVAVGTFCTFRS